MKRIGFFLLFAATLTFTSCSVIKVLSSAAKIAGSGVAQILADLYEKYKNSQTLTLDDATTLMSIAELGGYIKTLKENEEDASYLKAFERGLVSGSEKLITKENSSSVISSLLKIGELGTLPSAATVASPATLRVARDLGVLLKNLQP